MNDEECERQKQRLRCLADKWVQSIGLGWWDIDMAYARDDYEAPPAASSPDRSLAYCSADWRYGHACITWNLPMVRDTPDDKLERCFVHELMHIFLSETRETGDDWLAHEERVASTLTKAFLWLRDALTDGTEQPIRTPTLTGA
jgi:hypothetical protein